MQSRKHSDFYAAEQYEHVCCFKTQFLVTCCDGERKLTLRHPGAELCAFGITIITVHVDMECVSVEAIGKQLEANRKKMAVKRTALRILEFSSG